MKFQNVKGTRDFYPDQMRLRNWIADTWRRVSLRNGFEEYDAPIFEYLDLLTIKSGSEIAEQLFSFTDRGGRRLAIRPEITPSLARMVDAKINSLPRPIKWFSIPRLCRAENPQRGRLREFFQWNIDVIGSDDVLADAECIFTAVDFLREVGLTAQDVTVRIGSRPLTMAALRSVGVSEERAEKVFPILDKRPRVSEEEFRRLCDGVMLDDKESDAICRFQDCQSIEDLSKESFFDKPESLSALEDLSNLFRYLDSMGVGDYCRLDMRIVRGLAYYTGIVYEIFDRSESLRALAGGGRYDNLLELVGGPAVGATGFGMGDVVLEILLKEKNKLPPLTARLDFFVIDAGEGAFDRVLQLVGQLRERGWRTGYSFNRQNLRKQLKQASNANAAGAVLVRDEGPEPTMYLKNLDKGWQWPLMDSKPVPILHLLRLLDTFMCAPGYFEDKEKDILQTPPTEYTDSNRKDYWKNYLITRRCLDVGRFFDLMNDRVLD